MSFKRLDPEDIVISAESVVAPLWSTDEKYLTSFHTASGQVASNTGNYFYEIYETAPGTSTPANVQFSIAFQPYINLFIIPSYRCYFFRS